MPTGSGATDRPQTGLVAAALVRASRNEGRLTLAATGQRGAALLMNTPLWMRKLRSVLEVTTNA